MALTVCDKFLSIHDRERVVIVYFKWFDGSQLGDMYTASGLTTHIACDRDSNVAVSITISKDMLILEHDHNKIKMALSAEDRARVRKSIGEYFVNNA